MYIRFLFAAALLLLSSVAHSADYYYQASGILGQFSSAQAACDAYAVSRTQAGNGRYGRIVTTSSTTWRCTVYTSSGSPFNETTVTRLGDSCPPGSTYNSVGRCDFPNGEVCGPKDVTGLPQIKNASGQCVSFVLADKASQCNYAKNSVREASTTVQFDSNGVPSGPPTVDVKGCVAVPVGPSPYKNCKQDAPRKACFNGVCVELQSTAAKCNVAVQFTGAAGDGQFGFTGNPDDGTGPCDPDKDCTPNTPPINTDRQPCTYVTDAEGRQVCTSFDYKGTPGESSQCGQVNGQMTCISKKPPSSNGTQIDTKVETKSNPDGTTTTTKTDIRTDVNCTGPNACQSITTKTTNVTVKDSAGNVKSSDTKCQGAKCSSGIGKGDGTGTGNGDCIVDCEGQDGQVSAPQLGDVATYAQSIQAFQSAISGSPIMSAISSIAVTGSGSCNMSSANTAIGTISLDYICTHSNWLDGLYFVFLAVWGLAAVRVLLSA